MSPEINHSTLHHYLLSKIMSQGFAPTLSEIAAHFNTTKQGGADALQALADYHGVVLHPHTPEVWVIHPFSLAPTNFVVKSAGGIWWGNCAWCSLGVAALLKEDLTITTSYGAHGEQVVIEIRNGELLNKDLYIHFPVPMENVWDNVIYTCSTMLVFKNEAQIDGWCQRHNISKGDLQPIDKIWQFSKKWYGNHLNPNWRKWTIREAKAMFAEFALEHPVWQLEDSGERF